MNSAEAKKRIARLVKEIDELRYRYHVLNDPEVNDAVYDSLQQELQKLEEQFPNLKLKDSPLQRIGSKPLDKFKKITHQVRQWSFNDAFEEKAVRQWEERILKLLKQKFKDVKLEYVCELKIDGLHVVLTYEDGYLATAATRGDGVVGEDVTHNVKTINSVPLKLRKPLNIVVEGEIWLSEKQLQQINSERKKEGLPEFANPRNAAAGTIRQLDPVVAAKRKLDCYVYDWSGGQDAPPKTQAHELVLLQELGFKVNPHRKLAKNIGEVLEFWSHWAEHKKSQPYWIDGVVVKVNQRIYQEALGYVGKAPRWALAVKFPAEEVTTVVENISVQVGRLGTLTPVAHLTPVKLAGTTVKRATLHNEDQIRRLGVMIGDTVVIRKAGDIIPEVVSVLLRLRSGKEKKFTMPKLCPICNSEVVKKQTPGKTEGVEYYCSNRNCFAKQHRQLMHFVSKKAFNIDGLGEKIVQQLLNEKLIETSADIFDLTKAELLDLEGFADKSADNFLKSVEAAKKINLNRFIYALGIEGVGEQTALDLADHFQSIDKLAQASQAQLMEVEDIGPVVAFNINRWFSDKHHQAVLRQLLEKVQISKIKQIKSGPLFGKKVVVTGTLHSYSRDEIKELIRKAGGEWVSAVSKNTDYVLAGEKAGSKLNKAKQLGVKVLNEAELKKMLA